MGADYVYDICIVGTGPAGVMLALKLESAGKMIALLEGGDKVYSQTSQDLYKGSIFGDPYPDLDTIRLRFHGGSSNCWGGWCRHLDEEDFQPKSANPLTEWPIRKSDLDPYLKDASDFLGVTTIEDDEILGTSGLKEITFRYSKPIVRVAGKFGEKLNRSENIHQYFNANVTSFETNGRSVEAVNIADPAGKNSQLKANKYVLATGGIENSRILLWSDELANGALIRNGTTLGKYWMEHPHFSLGGALLTGKHKFTLDTRGTAFFAPTKKTMDENRTLSCGLRLRPRLYSDTKKIIADIACVAPRVGKWAAQLFEKDLICAANLYAAWEQEPRQINRIELSEEKDRLGVPRVKLFWRKSQTDLRTARKTAEILGQYFAESNIGRVHLNAWVLGNEEYPTDERIAGPHHMGGTRMASDPGSGIVDRNCKVHYQENLYISGSSVFPSCGHANPTLTLVQLAARLADHIKEKW